MRGRGGRRLEERKFGSFLMKTQPVRKILKILAILPKVTSRTVWSHVQGFFFCEDLIAVLSLRVSVGPCLSLKESGSVQLAVIYERNQAGPEKTKVLPRTVDPCDFSKNPKGILLPELTYCGRFKKKKNLCFGTNPHTKKLAAIRVTRSSYPE